MNYTAT